MGNNEKDKFPIHRGEIVYAYTVVILKSHSSAVSQPAQRHLQHPPPAHRLLMMNECPVRTLATATAAAAFTATETTAAAAATAVAAIARAFPSVATRATVTPTPAPTAAPMTTPTATATATTTATVAPAAVAFPAVERFAEVSATVTRVSGVSVVASATPG